MTFPRLRALGALALIASGPAAAQAWFFEDRTTEAGADVTHTLSAGYSGETNMMSGGAAAADVDGDGWPDLFVLSGDETPAVLLHNNGDGTFSDGSAASGLGIVTPAGMPNGAAFADVNGDGAPDLLIGGVDYVGASASGQAVPRLFLNDGNGVFTEATVASQIVSDRNTWSAGFGDFDRDGDLDLALAQWTKGAGGTGQLWRNDGSGVFTDISLAAGIAGATLGAHGDSGAPATCIGSDGDGGPLPRNPGAFTDQDFSFTPIFADIDSDGWPDLLIAADFCTSRVFRNQRDGTFADWTSDVIQDENGMGAAVADYDNDGDLDWFVTSIVDADGTVENGSWGLTGNKLYRNDGSGQFEQVAAAAGVDFGDWGWGACFEDFNNDGWLDLFHVNGMMLPAGAGETQFWDDPSRLFVSNGDGTFTEQGALRGADDTGQGRGVVCFDYDRDGDVDLYVNNHDGTGRLLRNNGGNLGGWLGVRLDKDSGNRQGVGARVVVTTAAGTQMRELQAGNHFLSSSPVEAFFGLGGETSARVEIRWPEGCVSELGEVAANQWLTVESSHLFCGGFE